LAGDLGDPALKTTAAASGRPPVQIATAKLFDLRRNVAYPSPTKPSSIIAQVDGSGTAVTEKAFPSIELSADPALPAKSL
jgi:hypothetical protein